MPLVSHSPHPSALPHSRSRSSSDPFSDAHVPARPAPTPSKQSSTPRRSDRPPAVDHPDPSKSHDSPQRRKVTRAVTSNPSPVPPSQAPPPLRGNRSLSQDSVQPDKRRQNRPKKGSIHADVIDRLDYSGVGAPMFHHDGPFDACTPSRNRHRTKAPMLAWSASAVPASSPLSVPEPSFAPDPSDEPALLYNGFRDSPYPSPPALHKPALGRLNSDFAGKGRLSEDVPKKRTDALAEAWGVAELEPYEEFYAGDGSGHASAASSLRAGRESHGHASQRSRDVRALAVEHDTHLSAPRRTSRAKVPPPKPISLPGGTINEAESNSQQLGTSPPRSPSAPKRSRSLMQRFRKMRETPNVPINDEEYDYSNVENQTSVGRRDHSPSGRERDAISPISDRYTQSYVIVGDTTQKSLPPPPIASPSSSAEGDGYFDVAGGGTASTPGAITRSTSLMRKVVRGVRRAGKV